MYAVRRDRTTLVLIKPDGVQRQLVGRSSPDRAEGPHPRRAGAAARQPRSGAQHYAEHEGKPFFARCWSSSPPSGGGGHRRGPRAIAAFRQLAGGTDPVEKAIPGTIRGDFGLETQFNLVHGSDSVESAKRENRALVSRP
nr:nucleoside-diphosphate kinase [Mycobacterium avium]